MFGANSVPFYRLEEVQASVGRRSTWWRPDEGGGRGGGPGTVGLGGDLDEDCTCRGFVDHDWIVFGQCEGRSGWYAGAAAPGRWCVLWRFGRLVSRGRQVASSVRFFLALFSS